ncbi:MAG: hypothetical protein ABMA64_40365 [Myxococcota bacterium]
MALWTLWLGCSGCPTPGVGALAPAARGDDWLRPIALDSGGLPRTASVHVPSGPRPAGGWPLVVLFHGGQGESGEDGRKMAAHWDHLRDQGFAMVFPNAIGTGARAWAGPDDRRDVTFTDDLIAWLDREIGVDEARVYAAGFSNGSGFTWMLQCVDADKFAGFGHVQQSMAAPVLERCAPTRHAPNIWFHGDADSKAEWDGNRDTIGVPRTLDYVLGFDGCDPSVTRVTPWPDAADDGTTVTRTVYPNCRHVGALELFRIHGGVHHWPTDQPSRSRRAGACRDVDAATEMVRFWREHAGL